MYSITADAGSPTRSAGMESPVRGASSPTATRVLAGKQVPEPLNFTSQTTSSSVQPHFSSDDHTPPSNAPNQTSRAASPATPDRAPLHRSVARQPVENRVFSETPTRNVSGGLARSLNQFDSPFGGVVVSIQSPSTVRRSPRALGGGAASGSGRLAGQRSTQPSLSPNPSTASPSYTRSSSGSSSLRGMPTRLSLASSQPGPSSLGQEQQQHPRAFGGPSRFLLTVVPPLHLPHDPPHPRTSQYCSGYGPPSQFR